MEAEFRCPACGRAVADDVDLEHDDCSHCGSAFGPAFRAARSFAESHLSSQDRAKLALLEAQGWPASMTEEDAIVEARYSLLLRQAFNSYSSGADPGHSKPDDTFADATMFTRWEFCRLEVETPTYSFASRVQQTVTLTWLGPRGYQVLIAVAGDDSSWSLTMNPWDYTIGALGEAGWELVSIQHADQTPLVDVHSMDVPSVAWDRALAVFKRPILSGRSIDDTVLFR